MSRGSLVEFPEEVDCTQLLGLHAWQPLLLNRSPSHRHSLHDAQLNDRADCSRRTLELAPSAPLPHSWMQF